MFGSLRIHSDEEEDVKSKSDMTCPYKGIVLYRERHRG
jgi:hypothetical protein